MPMHRRLPKKGFSNAAFRDKIETVSVDDLNHFADGSTITVESIIDKGLVTRTCDTIKILGDGELLRKLTVNVALISASAKEKIEKAGGTVAAAS